MARLYGLLDNRLEENKMFCEEIKVGTGVTEYLFSDRHAYEVVAVKDQKHVTIREYDHKHIGENNYDNSWELLSNEKNPTFDIVKRGNYWYVERTVTADEMLSADNDTRIAMAINGFDKNTILRKGKQTRYHKINVSFGIADYYYDYEF